VTQPAAGLTTLVDADGYEHVAFETARRTLCLDHLVADCAPGRATAGPCPTCVYVKSKLARRWRGSELEPKGLPAGALSPDSQLGGAASHASRRRS
jgi:hypothetical protein